jgi:phospholipid/cholesterol/gamma-HCH transport system substrate-binding protein
VAAQGEAAVTGPGEAGEPQEGLSPLQAFAVLAALLVAMGGLFYILMIKGPTYTVNARFQNAGQIVEGNPVEVAGHPVGNVSTISITDDGQAEIEMKIEDQHAPLRQGTAASVRQTSQSGIANRYVQLDLGPASATAIPDGGRIDQAQTVSAVDVDQLFNLLDKPTRTSLQRFLKGSADQWRGVGPRANRSLRYLNPFLNSFSRLFNELNRDSPNFENFLIHSQKLVTALAERRDDLSLLVQNLNQTTGAIGRKKAELASAVGQLPDFMRKANTAFVNLRATLDDLDPLVNASKPVAPRLTRFLKQLRPLAEDAEPTVKGLNRIIQTRGPRNDLVDLNKLQPAATAIAVGPVDRNGKSRPGALPVTASALRGAITPLAGFRPYTPELVGWFNDFSGKSGFFDANGGVARIAVVLNAFSPIIGPDGFLLGSLIPPSQRPANFQALATTGQYKRCPGSLERDNGDGSVPFTDGGAVDCDPSQVPPGP